MIEAVLEVILALLKVLRELFGLIRDKNRLCSESCGIEEITK